MHVRSKYLTEGNQFDQPIDQFEQFDQLVELIEEAIAESPPVAIRDGGFIAEGYNAELDELRKLSNQGKDWLLELETEEK